MLYVQQSLGAGEEILMGARFHWVYTMQAVFWILFGLAIGIAVGYSAIWWTVTENIRDLYPGLPEESFDEAWSLIVKSRGGYLQILWSQHPVLRFSILGFFLMGLFFFTHMMIVKATTEIAVTTEVAFAYAAGATDIAVVSTAGFSTLALPNTIVIGNDTIRELLDIPTDVEAPPVQVTPSEPPPPQPEATTSARADDSSMSGRRRIELSSEVTGPVSLRHCSRWGADW